MNLLETRKAALIAGVAVLAADQVSKVLVRSWLPRGSVVPVIEGFFNIVHVRNRGVAFSLLGDLPPSVINPILLVITGGVFLFLLYILFRRDPLFHPRLSLGLVAGGAAGNILDRILHGDVTDFLDFYAGRYHWPAFNVADAAITCGIILILLFTLLPNLRGEKRKLE